VTLTDARRHDRDHRGAAGMCLSAPPPLRLDQALFLDFDGTLVEIASAPALVRVSAQLPGLLSELARRLGGAVAVVSGRPLDELTGLLAPFAGAMSGQHGLERRRSDGSAIRCATQPALGQIRPAVVRFAARHHGLILEDKGSTLALHYRQAPSLGARCRALIRRTARASGGALQAIAGKMVIELMPRSGGKGQAITEFLAEEPFRGRTPVFIGDDITDEDGFAAVNRLGGISIRVGAGVTIARHHLATVEEVWSWLAQGLTR
jgi:trehalose 6-phosphate phosphatase